MIVRSVIGVILLLLAAFGFKWAYLAYLPILQVVSDTRPIDRLREMRTEC